MICKVCAHYCDIKENFTGICKIRKNINGEIKLLNYGKVVSLAIDPIEKKPIYDFKNFEKGKGALALSYALFGCNFKCKFCQNHTISQIDSKTFEDDLKKIKTISPNEIVNIALTEKIPFIAHTYSEPTVWLEYSFDVMKLAHQNGIKNIFVSNGYQSKETREKILPYLDAINIDLKAGTDEKYFEFTKGHLKPVLDNIKYFYENNVHVEVTTLIVPGMNDSDFEIEKIAKEIANVSTNISWHISRFFPRYKMLEANPTELEILKKAENFGRKLGIKRIYTGNIP